MLPESSGRLVALRVSGKLTKQDMVLVAPPLEEKIRENGKVDLICDMTDFHGWSLGGFWAELKFDTKHAKDFRRVAFITGKPLHRFMASMLKPFMVEHAWPLNGERLSCSFGRRYKVALTKGATKRCNGMHCIRFCCQANGERPHL